MIEVIVNLLKRFYLKDSSLNAKVLPRRQEDLRGWFPWGIFFRELFKGNLI